MFCFPLKLSHSNLLLCSLHGSSQKQFFGKQNSDLFSIQSFNYDGIWVLRIFQTAAFKSWSIVFHLKLHIYFL
jgi:hypothetical protein